MAKKKELKKMKNPWGTAFIPNQPYFFRWVEQCQKLPEDMWQRAPKRSKVLEKAVGKGSKVIIQAPVKIVDMHTMQLVNAIKWCLSQAGSYLNSGCFAGVGFTKAELLAAVPQWRSLLAEGRKRKLYIIGDDPHFLPWYEEAMKAIVFTELEK